MNNAPMLPAQICLYYNHEFVKEIQQYLGEQWVAGKGMVKVYKNICVRCDHWFHFDAEENIIPMRD